MSRSRESVVIEQGPEVQLLGDAAVLRGPAALDAYRVLVEGIAAVRRRDAIEPNVRLMRAVAALKAAADANRSQASDTADIADVRDRPVSASLISGGLIGIREVARMLDVGDRQARRLAPSLGGHKKRSGTWSFDRAMVQRYIDCGGLT